MPARPNASSIWLRASIPVRPWPRTTAATPCADQLERVPVGAQVQLLGDDFDAGPDAFLDTAALMQRLDLVVGCDSVMNHLAGALGRPAWIGLRYVPEFRWMLDRADSPWYPSLRLFRQPAVGDWAQVFSAMAGQLRKIVGRPQG